MKLDHLGSAVQGQEPFTIALHQDVRNGVLCACAMLARPLIPVFFTVAFVASLSRDEI